MLLLEIIIGIANAWSDPLPFPRTIHRWTKAESGRDVLKRLAPRPRTRQEEAALASLRKLPTCANCPPGTLPRFGAGGELVPGGGTSLLNRAEGDESQAEKALALWPAEAGEAYLAMPENTRCRGFMFWAISFEVRARPSPSTGRPESRQAQALPPLAAQPCREPCAIDCFARRAQRSSTARATSRCGLPRASRSICTPVTMVFFARWGFAKKPMVLVGDGVRQPWGGGGKR